MKTVNIDNYRDSVGKLFLDENDRFPLGILDDFVINSRDLKIEGFLIRDGFFKDSKVVKKTSVDRWSDILYVKRNSIKSLNFFENIKNILIEGNGIIWKKVVSETGESLGRVCNLVFSTSSFIGLSIVVRKNFFGLFFYGKERIVSRKNILDINKNEIVVVSKILAKA